MTIRAIPRTAVDTYLKLVRLPLESAIGWLPGNGTGAQPAAGLVLDRADAAVRAVLGTVLADPVLREDAQRRRAAAEERERALDLRTAADRKTEHADTRLQERHQQASRQRQQADQRAKAKRQEAAREQEKEKRRTARTQSTRLDASRKTAERREKVLNNRAANERLETLDAKTDALHEKEKELTARDEAKRLNEAASRAKAERKNG